MPELTAATKRTLTILGILIVITIYAQFNPWMSETLTYISESLESWTSN